MDASFQSLEANLAEYQRPIYNVLKSTLDYPAHPEAIPTKLAEDISFMCGWKNDLNYAKCLLWDVWKLVLDIASCIPPEHAWQFSLGRALYVLKLRNDSVIAHDEHGTFLWKDLPNLGMVIREAYIEPDAEESIAQFRWKNLNAFLARFIGAGESARPRDPDEKPGLTLPIWGVREGLETSPVKGPAMECRVAVAASWITHCAYCLYMEMHPKAEVDETMVRVAATRELADGIVPHSPERWVFWKKRLTELSSNVRDLEMDESVVEELEEALEAMEAVEGKAKSIPAEGPGESGETSVEKPDSSEESKTVPAQELEGTVVDKVDATQEVEEKDNVGS